MKKFFWSVLAVLTLAGARAGMAADALSLLPEDTKLVVILKNFSWADKLITAMADEDDEEDLQKMQSFLAEINQSESAYIAYFGKAPDLETMTDSIESNLVILITLDKGTQSFYQTMAQLTEEEMEKHKNGVVSIEDFYILPLTGNQIAIAPSAEILYRYKKAKMLTSAKTADAQAIKTFIQEYQDKAISAMVVPSVFDKAIKDSGVKFPEGLEKYDITKDVKDLIMYLEENSFVMSVRMKKSSDALRNIFTPANRSITVEQFSRQDPVAFLELGFSRGFLKDILNWVLVRQGSEMPEATLDSVLDNLTGNFGVLVYPQAGTEEKDLFDSIPDMLAFIGSPSDSAAIMLIGMAGAMQPFTTETIEGKEVYVMDLGGDGQKIYLTVDRAHIVGSNKKDLLSSYLKNSKSGIDSMKNELITSVSSTEILGLSLFLKAKEFMQAVQDELPFGDAADISRVEKVLLYLGPSEKLDAFNIKILYK